MTVLNNDLHVGLRIAKPRKKNVTVWNGPSQSLMVLLNLPAKLLACLTKIEVAIN